MLKSDFFHEKCFHNLRKQVFNTLSSFLEINIAVVGGYDGSSDVKEVEVIRITDDGILKRIDCRIPPIEAFRAQSTDSMICGGFPATNECFELNSDSMKWKTISPMLKKRVYHSMTSTKNVTVYVCGGWDESYKRLSSCEKFDGRWKFIKDLPTLSSGHCMVATENELFSFGGWEGSGVRKLL